MLWIGKVNKMMKQRFFTISTNRPSRRHCSKYNSLKPSAPTVQSQSIPAGAQDPFPPSVRHYSPRQSKSVNINSESLFGMTNIREFFLSKHVEEELLWYILAPPIVRVCSIGIEPRVIWHLRVDIVDLLSPRSRSRPTWRSGKRRRTTLDPSIKCLLHLWKARPQENVQPKQSDSSHYELDIAHALLEQRSFKVEY